MTRRYSRGKSRNPSKTFTSQSLIGQEGINLIERIVLDMKCLWHPTLGPDIGIDGQIELCNQVSGASLHQLIAVQSRATSVQFAGESDTTLEYTCDERDLDYWMQGNLPVILVRSRPSSGEAYWIPVKEFFADPRRRASRKVIFNKATDQFDASVYQRLLSLATPAGRGPYLGPVPKTERLVTNLLPVRSMSPRIYVAGTEYRDPKEVWDALRDQRLRVGREWILRNKKLISFLDLREAPWPHVCDRGTVDEFATEEWATTADADRRSEFVQLLRWALRCRLEPDVQWDPDLEIFFFPPRTMTPPGSESPELVSYSAEYQAPTRKSSRTVFEVYRRSDGSVKYCRHYAFIGHFRRHDDEWFLEINPTYHFTWDGYRPSFWADQLASGIKRLDRNPAVLAALRLWAQTTGREGLLGSPNYPHLTFGELVTLELGAGINDVAWQASEDPAERKVLQAEENQLFETLP